MAMDQNASYQNSRARYKYYYQRIWRFYQKPVYRVSLALLLTVFTIIFFAVFAISPTLNTIGELLRKIEDQREVLEKLQNKSAALATVQNEYNLISDRLDILDAAYPEYVELQQFLRYIEATASLYEIPVDAIRVNETVVINQEGEYTDTNEVAISITIVEEFDKLKAFLGDVTNIPRLVSVDAVRFSIPPEDELEELGYMTMTINIKGYFSSEM